MPPYRTWFWTALGLITLARLYFIGQFELSPDEAYYWTWSRHLSWSYYDQGPMLALIIRATTTLLGSISEWSVRLGAVILSCLSSWMFFAWLARLFKSERVAWYGFLGLQAGLLFSVGAVLMMHDSIMIGAWMAALFAFSRACLEDWSPGWWWGALALGLGGLSKYTMALFVPCLLLFLVLSPRQRIGWRKPQLYLAGAITLMMISPVLVWNATHGWASFGHVGNLSGLNAALKFSWKTLGDFIGGQLGVMTPFLGGLCFWAPWLAWKTWRRNREENQVWLYLFCFSAPILLFFLLLSMRSSVYANWAAPAYPAALAILAGWLVPADAGPLPRNRRVGVAITLGSAVLLTLLVHLEAGWGVFKLTGPAARSLDRIRGWQQVGEETSKRLPGLQAEYPDIFLAARRYQIAAQLSFYLPQHPEVQLLSREQPPNNHYRFINRSAGLAGKSVLYVCEDPWEIDHIQSQFDRVQLLEIVPILFQGRTIREIRYYLGLNYHPPSPSEVAP